LIENSQPFGKKFQKTVGGDFFDSHCTYIRSATYRQTAEHRRHLSPIPTAWGGVSTLFQLIRQSSSITLTSHDVIVIGSVVHRSLSQW